MCLRTYTFNSSWKGKHEIQPPKCRVVDYGRDYEQAQRGRRPTGNSPPGSPSLSQSNINVGPRPPPSSHSLSRSNVDTGPVPPPASPSLSRTASGYRSRGSKNIPLGYSFGGRLLRDEVDVSASPFAVIDPAADVATTADAGQFYSTRVLFRHSTTLTFFLQQKPACRSSGQTD